MKVLQNKAQVQSRSMDGRGKAEETAHLEEVKSTESQGFNARIKTHLRRFWWLHLIIFIACTLIIVLCLSVDGLAAHQIKA